MKEKPILFKGEMVRAIISGEKTQTRRIIKDVWEVMPERAGDPLSAYKFKLYKDSKTQGDPVKINPPYITGQKLYVKETWAEGQSNGKDKVLFYRATDEKKVAKGIKWKPSIFMFKKYARIWLEVADIKIERVQNISEEDSLKEGVPNNEDYPNEDYMCPECGGDGVHGALGENMGITEVDCCECDTAIKRFMLLWDSINERRGFGWNSNPWVWVTEFKRIK